MRRLLSQGLVVFAGLVAAPPIVPTVQHASAPEYRNDPRLDSLRRFFEAEDCPAAAFSQEFLNAADENNLDWRLLPSISYIESTGGKMARGNNFFGWNSGKTDFTSVPEAIRTVADRLANSELYRDKNLNELLITYNPFEDYPGKVKRIMQRIESVE
jgi:hypothetical protein